MKKIFGTLLFIALLIPFNLQAQQTDDLIETTPETTDPAFVAGPNPALLLNITADDIVEVNGNIIFNAESALSESDEEAVIFEWNLGDETESVQGKEVVHTYPNAGRYVVTLTAKQVLENGTEQVLETVNTEVYAYNKLLVLITNVSEKEKDIENLIRDAEEEGTHIFMISSFDINNTTAFISEETLFNKLRDQVPTLNKADAFVIWTTRSSGINALTRLVQETNENEEQQNPVQQKDILFITSGHLNSTSRILQGNFNIIQPRQMIIVRQHDLKNFTTALSTDEFVSYLESSLSDYRIVNAETGRVRVWNAISSLVNFMISQGVPSNTIVLLLMLPVIATLIAFMKNVIGVTTFGVYIPSIITLSFLALGLRFGLLILFIIIVTGALVRKLLSGWRLLHVPRVAILLTISTLIILLTLAFGTYLGITSIATIAVFPMLIMTTLAERFVTALSGKGFFAATLLMLETTLVSLICYWVVEWHYLQNLILGRPELILLLLLVNYALGRWTGLRLMEYVRFREVMKHAEE